ERRAAFTSRSWTALESNWIDSATRIPASKTYKAGVSYLEAAVFLRAYDRIHTSLSSLHVALGDALKQRKSTTKKRRTRRGFRNNLRFLRCFVVDSLRSLHLTLRRPETMKINHEETKGTKKVQKKSSCSSLLRG